MKKHLILLFLTLASLTTYSQNTSASENSSAMNTQQVQNPATNGAERGTPGVKTENLSTPSIGKISTSGEISDTSNLRQFILPAMVLLFGILMVLFSLLMVQKETDFNTDTGIRIVSLTLIITGVLFIVTLGNSAQLANNITSLYAPAFGLLGTIAGYLLGKLSENKSFTQPAPQTVQGSQATSNP